MTEKRRQYKNRKLFLVLGSILGLLAIIMASISEFGGAAGFAFFALILFLQSGREK